MEKSGAIKNTRALIIGGSAGSLEVLLSVLPNVKEDLGFPIIIILHRKTGIDNMLTDLFSTRTSMPVTEIEEKEQIQPNHIYIAPADYHLLIESDLTFSFDCSEKVNYSRPSIDVAFESASEVYKERLAALLLSGANADGVAGLKRVSSNMGLVLIQDPDTATVAYMPSQAKLRVDYDALLKPGEMADYINSLSKNESNL